MHGSTGSRPLRMAGQADPGLPVCLTVTHVDGLVLARSAFHHSINYRSVVVHGTAHQVTDPEEKRAALDALVDHVVPGPLADSRPADAKELAATAVLRLDLDEVSAKVRTGGPNDDPRTWPSRTGRAWSRWSTATAPRFPRRTWTRRSALPEYLRLRERVRDRASERRAVPGGRTGPPAALGRSRSQVQRSGSHIGPVEPVTSARAPLLRRRAASLASCHRQPRDRREHQQRSRHRRRREALIQRASPRSPPRSPAPAA